MYKAGEYQPSKGIAEFLIEELGLGARRQAMKLVTYLLRMNGGPQNLGRTFHIKRNQLGKAPDLGMSADQVYRAKKILEASGAVEVVHDEDGGKWRKAREGSAWTERGQHVIERPKMYRFCEPILAMLRFNHAEDRGVYSTVVMMAKGLWRTLRRSTSLMPPFDPEHPDWQPFDPVDEGFPPMEVEEAMDKDAPVAGMPPRSMKHPAKRSHTTRRLQALENHRPPNPPQAGGDRIEDPHDNICD